MDQNNNNKILTLSFIGAGALLAFVFTVLIRTITPLTSGAIARGLSSDFVLHVLPVIVGFILFLALQFNKKVLVWGDEVITEIKKVVWPSRKDTVAMTIVVCIMVIISAAVIGMFDVLSSFFVDYLVSL